MRRERWGYKNTNDDLRVYVAREEEEEEEEKKTSTQSHETVCVSNNKKSWCEKESR